MKKAKLDLLQEMPDIELAKPEVEPVAEEQIEEIPVESGRPWALNKLMLIAAPVGLVLIIITGILIYFLYSHTQTPSSRTEVTMTSPAPVRKPDLKQPTTAMVQKPVAVPVVTRTVYIKDFMIDLKDNKGNSRILLCDVAFDIAGDSEREKLEGSEDVRNIVYRTAQSRSAVALKSVEERKKLKKELADQLDKLAGKAVVKNVYFINYLII